MNSSRNTYADSLKGFVDVVILQQPHSLDDVLEREFWIGYRHDRFARKKSASEVNDCKDRAIRANIEGKRHQQVIYFQAWSKDGHGNGELPLPRAPTVQ